MLQLLTEPVTIRKNSRLRVDSRRLTTMFLRTRTLTVMSSVRKVGRKMTSGTTRLITMSNATVKESLLMI